MQFIKTKLNNLKQLSDEVIFLSLSVLVLGLMITIGISQNETTVEQAEYNTLQRQKDKQAYMTKICRNAIEDRGIAEAEDICQAMADIGSIGAEYYVNLIYTPRYFNSRGNLSKFAKN